MFAGGVWTWEHFCPHFSKLKENTVHALASCRRMEIKEVLATIWHDGSESSLILGLFGLAWYADFGYRGEYSEDGVSECFAFSCGQKSDDFMLLEQPDYPEGLRAPSGARSLLYNDPLIGLVDLDIEGCDTASHYRNMTDKLSHTSDGGNLFEPAFNVIRALCSLLENKGDYSVRLRRAYLDNDRKQLAEMLSECDIIIKKLHSLKAAHRESWMIYNKPFGWEVHDIRYGGLISRFETTKYRLKAYLSGELKSIEELEPERLPTTDNRGHYKYFYSVAATVNRLE